MFCVCASRGAGAGLDGGGSSSVSSGQRRRNKAVYWPGDEHQERQDLPGEYPAGHLSAGGRKHRDTGHTDNSSGQKSYSAIVCVPLKWQTMRESIKNGEVAEVSLYMSSFNSAFRLVNQWTQVITAIAFWILQPKFLTLNFVTGCLVAKTW